MMRNGIGRYLRRGGVEKIKRISGVVLILILAGMLLSCKDSTQDNTIKNTTPTLFMNTQNQTEEEFYGSWVIKRVVAFARIYGLSDDDIKGMIGKRIQYFANFIRFDNEVYNKPNYIKSVVSENDFFEDNGYTYLKEIGIEGDHVNRINVSSDDPNFDQRSYYFIITDEFYIKDQDTVIANLGGVFFELKREK